MRILYFELYCIPCHWAVVSVLSDCLFYDILLIFVSFLPFIFIVPLESTGLFTLVMRTLHKSDEICALEWNDGNIPSKIQY